MKTKTVLGFMVLFLVSALCFQAAYAESVITNRTGTIEITNPDGTTLIVGKDEPLPGIPFGAIVEILDGEMDVAPTIGFIQVVAGGATTIVEAGNKVNVVFNRKTQIAGFKVDAGKVNVIVGNSTATLETGEKMLVSLNERTGVVEIESVKGVVEVVTAGVEVSIPKGAAAKISADAKTKNVHVEAKTGSIIVVTISGEVVNVSPDKSIDTPGSAVGEIQTFPGEAEEVPVELPEEPSEPERPEGSDYR